MITGWKRGGPRWGGPQRQTWIGLIPPTGTALQVPARCSGVGDANCFSKAPRILSAQSHTDTQGLLRETSCNHLDQGETLKGGGGWRGGKRAVFERPRGSSGTGLVPAAKGSGWRVAPAGPDIQAASPPPVGPGELGREWGWRPRTQREMPPMAFRATAAPQQSEAGARGAQ